MDEKNKVVVKIYGQQYTIAGEIPKDHILNIAGYVDAKMRELEKALPAAATSSLAVLSAVNIADDLFKAVAENKELAEKNAQLQNDTKHYVGLWEEAKKNFVQYKESAQSNQESKNELEQLVNEQTIQLASLTSEHDELKKKYQSLQKKNEDLVNRLKEQDDSKSSNSSQLKELEAKCKDVESSFFDLQMENIQLKGELDRYKKMME